MLVRHGLVRVKVGEVNDKTQQRDYPQACQRSSLVAHCLEIEETG